MLFTKVFITLLASATFAAATAAAAVNDIALFRRSLTDEIYERDVQMMGLASRDEHPDHEAVAAEVEHAVRRNVPGLISRSPMVDCSTLLDSCSYNSECQIKSAQCAGCSAAGKCQEDRPASSPTSSTYTNSRIPGNNNNNNNKNKKPAPAGALGS